MRHGRSGNIIHSLIAVLVTLC